MSVPLPSENTLYVLFRILLFTYKIFQRQSASTFINQNLCHACIILSIVYYNLYIQTPVNGPLVIFSLAITDNAAPNIPIRASFCNFVGYEAS